VDSEPVWTVAERELFATWGVVFTPAMKAAMVGSRMDASVRMMIDFGGGAAANSTVKQVSAFLTERMAELFRAQLPVLPGVLELLGAAVDAGVPQALVSSTHRALVDAVLRGLPGHPFAVSVAGDEVRHGKPHPEPYETAAARLGVDPRRCVVLEDTPTGARAGAAAGARVVYCPSVIGAGEAEPGWLPVSSLADVSLADLGALLSARSG
ncbi:MAG: HAD family hydrolase, partial [Mycobacteriales bacterium]